MYQLTVSRRTKALLISIVFITFIAAFLFLINGTASGSTPPSTPEPSTSARPAPRLAPNAQLRPLNTSAAPGYCTSSGGDTSFEYISDVKLTPNPGGTMKLTVQVYIANPTGCVAGEECPEYDSSPEYVNVWIDWNGDKKWDSSERVMDAALTGYLSINYRGTMTAVGQFTPPPSVDITDEPTWMRANLGWSFDPNDPCEPSWTWGNVVDQELHLKGPKILDITAKGVGTPGENPQTGDTVRLEAVLDVPGDYEITQCSWTGDLTAGNGDINNNCRYDYIPKTGPGPAVDTYGEKNITLTLSFKNVPSGNTGQTARDHTYKVFFEKGSSGAWADDDGDGDPNWFEYWADDGAVTALGAGDVFYDQTLGANTYGFWSPSDDNIHVGGAAARTHYPGGLNVPAVASTCPGGNFGDVKGIDAAAEVLTHERRHETINHNWKSGGPWVGLTDSDEGVPSAGFDDDLPDTYETSAGTRNDNVDSCDLATHKSATYNTYGDNEFDAMNTSDGAVGVAANDWANPGKRSTPPFLAQSNAPASLSETNSKSGVAGLYAPYNRALGPAAALAGSLTGSYASAAVDTDTDGKYNQLKISVGLQIDSASLYNVVLWLEDGSSTPIGWANTQQSLAIGNHTVDVYFDGFILQESGLDGPYNVAHIELREGDEEGLVDSADNVHTTAAYLASDFDPRPVAFSGSYSDSGIDSGVDGLYDWLRIPVGLNVEASGTYSVTGELEGSRGIAVARTSATLSKGATTINLDFDGNTIFQHRENGPYHLRWLRVEAADGSQVHFVADAFTTASYSYSQFQHGGTTFTAGSFSDLGLDVDSDGDYDYLRLQFSVNSDTAGSYRLMAALKDNLSREIDSLSQSVDLSVGSTALHLDFPGGAIFNHGVDGPYQLVSFSLVDGNGNIVDFLPNAHTTQAYSYTDFTQLLVTLNGNFADYGEDTDGNGKYNHLVIAFDVTPGDAGVIVVQGRLVDGLGKEIAWAENFKPMTGGTAQTITLAFFGPKIYASGKNGPYELHDLVIYHTGDPEQAVEVSNAYLTSAYNYTDFETGHDVYLPLILR